MAVVKANYVKRGKGDRGRAKATIRYITHRPGRDGEKLTRQLFGYDGTLTKAQAYQMIDDAGRGTIFYRIVLSPAPKREDRFRDLNLSEITIHTMLALEERLGKHMQFVAAIHDDHSPHRHVHTLVLVQGARLTREDFQALRLAATEQALSQRRMRDRIRGHHLGKGRFRAFTRNPSYTRKAGTWRLSRGTRPYQSYTCSLCGYHQALPSSNLGYRCPSCGLRMRRDRIYGLDLARRRQRGFGLELSLSP